MKLILIAPACALLLLALSADHIEGQRRARVVIGGGGGTAKSVAPSEPETQLLPPASRPLNEEELSQLKSLVAELDADDYATRERATIKLMLMPIDAAHRLSAAYYGDTSEIDIYAEGVSDEVRSRVREVLDAAISLSPIDAVIARLSDVPLSSLGESFTDAVRATELIQRIPADFLAANQRLIARIYVRAGFKSARDAMIAHTAEKGETIDPLELYAALEEHEAGHIDARMDLLAWVSSEGQVDALLHLGSVMLADERVDTPRVELLLRNAFTARLAPDELLSAYQTEEDPQARMVYLVSTTLTGASPEVRKAWIDIDFDGMSDEMQRAYLSMACREGLHEALEQRLGSASMPPDFYRLLAVIGTPELWQRVLSDDVEATELRIALSWLPYSELAPIEQARELMHFIHHADAGVRSMCVHLLKGYGLPLVVNNMLEILRASENADSPGVHEAGEVLGSHGWWMATIAEKPWQEAWFSKLRALDRASILSWYDLPASSALLEALVFSSDSEAALIAQSALAVRGESFLAHQIRSQMIHAGNSSTLIRSELLALSVEEARARLAANADLMRKAAADAERSGVPGGTTLQNRLAERSAEIQMDIVSLVRIGDEDTIASLRNGEYRLARVYHASNIPPKFDLVESEYILTLSGYNTDSKSLDRLLEREPQLLLRWAPMLVESGRSEVLVRALKVLTERLELPTKDEDISDATIRALARAFSHGVKDEDLNGFIYDMARNKLEAISTLPMVCLAMAGGHEGYLDALARVSLNVARTSYQIKLLMAAASAPDLNQKWIDNMRLRWDAIKPSKETLEALDLLDAIVAQDEIALFSAVNGSTLATRIAAATALARMGKRACLHLLVDSFYKMQDSATLTPLGSLDSSKQMQIAASFDLNTWCQGMPEGATESQARLWWNSTRYLWRWSDDAGQYVLPSELDE